MGDVGRGVAVGEVDDLALISHYQQPMAVAARPVNADDGGIACGDGIDQSADQRACGASELFEADLVAEAVEQPVQVVFVCAVVDQAAELHQSIVEFA